MKKVALAVCRQFSDYHPCDTILASKLADCGYEVSKEFWNDEDCQWDKYDLVVLRSACDYIDNIDEFLSWVSKVSTKTKLVNNEELIKNNYNKVYLKKLETKGIDIVPTQIAESTNDLISVINNLNYDEFVLKAAVGARGMRTYHFNKDQLSEIVNTASTLKVSSKTPMLVQPYIKEIYENGEISAMYFNGKFSFAVKRHPITQEVNLTGGDNEELYHPSEIEKEFCSSIITLYDQTPVYAKIDYVVNNGKPMLVKTGLIEPNLYFDVAPQFTDDFIGALKNLL